MSAYPWLDWTLPGGRYEADIDVLERMASAQIPNVHLEARNVRGMLRNEARKLILEAYDLVFLDESGCNTNMTRRYAYSLGGSRAVDSAPLSKPGTRPFCHLSSRMGRYTIRLSQAERQ